MALSKHAVDEWMNEWMGAWLDFLHLFSCMCIVPLILEQILGGRTGLPLDFHAGSWASCPHACQGQTGHATPSEPREVGAGVSRPQLLRGLCWKQLLACVSEEPRKCQRVNGSDNQALAIKTATHSSLSDSTREIFQMCQFLHVSNGREKDAPKEACGARADWLEPSPAPTGKIQCGYEVLYRRQQLERNGNSIREWDVWLSSQCVK